MNWKALLVALCLLTPQIGRANSRSSAPLMPAPAARSGAAVVEFVSPDWSGRDNDLKRRVDDVLRSRPRFLAPQIMWAEGADLRRETLTATLRRADGAAARLSVSGYQVCLRDASGELWFFRKVPLDLWPD